MNTIDFILIIIFTILCFFACSQKLKNKINKNNPIHNINKQIRDFIGDNYIYLTAAVFLMAIIIRTYKFGIIPYGFNQDEAMAALEGLTLSNYGTDHYGMSFPVYFTAWMSSQMNVLLSYIMIPFIKIFGASEFAARLPLLVFSLISIWVIYKFTYRVFGEKAALAILFFTAINPWQIMISRWALEANLFPHLMLYSVYLLYLGLEKRRIYLYLSMLIFGVSMYSYGISYYAVPLLLVILCVYLLYTKSVRPKDVLICFLCYIAISWPIFLMMAVNYFKLETIKISIMSIPFFEYGQRMSDVLFFSDNMYSQLISNFNSLLHVAFFQGNDLPWNSIPSVGPLYFCAIPLFITGFVLIIKKLRSNNTENKRGVFIISALFATAFISGLITNNVNINRINLIFFPMIILIGYAIFIICKRFNFMVVPITLTFILLFVNFSSEYFTGDHSKKLGKEFYYGYGSALGIVKDLNYDKLYITSKTQFDNSPFVSEIMALYLLEIDNKYYRGETELSDPDGVPYPIYRERYIYGIDENNINTNDIGTIYIIHRDEAELFNEKYFNFTYIGSYCAVVHRGFGN